MPLSSLKKSLKKHTFVYLSLYLSLFLPGCAIIAVPSKQKVNIKVDNDSTSIYVDGEEQGVGSAQKVKIKKTGFHSVVLKTPGYNTQHEILLANKYATWMIPFAIIDIPLGFGFITAAELGSMDKRYSYQKNNEMKLNPALVKRNKDEKYIDIDGLKIKYKNSDKNYETFNFNKTIEENIAKVDRDNAKKQASIVVVKDKNAPKKKLEKEEPQIQKNDFLANVLYKKLAETGFVDTISEVFLDNNNTIVIEPYLNSSSEYYFTTNSKLFSLLKKKVNTTWYLKNTYGERLDSITLESMSGAFTAQRYISSFNSAAIHEDIVNQALQDLLRSDEFKEYAKIDTNLNIADAPLAIAKPKNLVTDASDATLASVIIKRKDKGHGSGFAISNDGYILTNYHVIAGEYANKQAEFTVILSNGEEVKAQVVRFNKMRDVALLKVDAKFEKAFDLRSEKTFKRLMNVYTVGTPKSIELGQSVSLGILSNERSANNRNLLQLNMSVNSGNSGGPLFDQQGVLHGIVTSKLVGANTEGVSFAIPSYKIAEYLNLKH